MKPLTLVDISPSVLSALHFARRGSLIACLVLVPTTTISPFDEAAKTMNLTQLLLVSYWLFNTRVYSHAFGE